MAKAKKNSAIDLAFGEFDTIIDTFFKEASASLKDLNKPEDPKQPKQRKPRLPKFSNPFNV
jgi:hypothetical protein